MEPAWVVEGLDVVKEAPLRFAEIGEEVCVQVEFGFEFAPEAFDVGVFVAVVGAGEAGEDFQIQQQCLKGAAGILAAFIGMVEQAGSRPASAPGFGQGLLHQGGVDFVAEAPADDFAAEQIHDGSQVEPALASRQVSDISDPGLVGMIGRAALSQSIGRKGGAGRRGFGTEAAFLQAAQAEGAHQTGDAIFTDAPTVLA